MPLIKRAVLEEKPPRLNVFPRLNIFLRLNIYRGSTSTEAQHLPRLNIYPKLNIYRGLTSTRSSTFSELVRELLNDALSLIACHSRSLPADHIEDVDVGGIVLG